MRSTISLGEDGIVYTQLIGTDSIEEIKEWAESLKKVIKSEYEKRGKIDVLTDLTGVKLTDDIK